MARLLGRRVSPSSAEIVGTGLLDVVPVQVAAGCHSSAAGRGRAAMVSPVSTAVSTAPSPSPGWHLPDSSVGWDEGRLVMTFKILIMEK